MNTDTEEKKIEDKINEIRGKLNMPQKNFSEVCDHCGGTGYDPHPNHSTSYPICPQCGDNPKQKPPQQHENK